jgi:lysophospholipase L1-like esterase
MLAFGDSITYGLYASDVATLGYAGLLASTLGVGIENVAIAGATLLGTEGQPSILAQILPHAPPPRYTPCVTIVGTNDAIAYGTDAGRLATFQAGLEEGLLHLTSRRRTREPKTVEEIILALKGGAPPSVSESCTVWIGTMTRQSAWFGSSSEAAWAAYVAATTAAVSAVGSRGRDVRLVDTASAYDPDTMGADPPMNIHPNDVGHLALKTAFYTAMLP